MTPLSQMSGRLRDEMGGFVYIPPAAESPERRLLLAVIYDAVSQADGGCPEAREWFREPGDPDDYRSWAFMAATLGLEAESFSRAIERRWWRQSTGVVLTTPRIGRTSRFRRRGGGRRKKVA